MSNFVVKPPFSNSLRVAIETMHVHIAHTNCFRIPLFRIQGVPMNNLAPMKIILGCKVTYIGCQGSSSLRFMQKQVNEEETQNTNKHRPLEDSKDIIKVEQTFFMCLLQKYI